MPELPEVETVVRGLAPVLEGGRIAELELRRPDLRYPFPEGLAWRVAGCTITAVRRRAKYILIDVAGPTASEGEKGALLMHLGMSGRVSLAQTGRSERLGTYIYDQSCDPKHDHVILHLEGGGGFVLNDPRRFGFLDWVPADQEESHRFLKDLGPEPLSGGFNAHHLLDRSAGKQVSAKAFLLDQRKVAGLGNIYVCEALWRARVSPRRLAGHLGAKRAARLVEAVKTVLTEAIAAGGSTLRDFAGVEGAIGLFPHSFAVYGREGEPCRRCDEPVRRIVQSARSTFYCGACQR